MLPGFDAKPLVREFKTLMLRAFAAFTSAENVAVRTSLGAQVAGNYASTSLATETAAGLVELATTAEVQTGTDIARVPSISAMREGLIVHGTEVATTSGTAFDFSIPAWAKFITVHFDGVSTNATSPFLIQLGDSGGVENTGYKSTGSDVVGSSAVVNTTGFVVGTAQSAGAITNGHIDLKMMDAATFKWTAVGSLGRTDAGQQSFTSGVKNLSSALTTVRVTTTAGATFDAGSLNVSYF